MSIYYFENENGTFFSEDGKRRFIRLSGKEAYDYMRENKTGDSYFVQTVTNDTEDGEKVFVEVPKSSVSVYRGSTYHAQYLSKMRKKKRYRLVSLYHPTEDGDGTAVVDKYSDDGHTVEDIGLSDKEDDAVYTTNAYGQIIVENLPCGKNYFMEVKTADGYMLYGDNFTVSLKKDYLQQPGFYTADHVAIRFSAVLNKYATTEPVGNPNEAVKLTYTNKNDVKGEVDGNKVFVYTYHIQVHKLDEKGKALKDAEFALYKTEADAKAEKNAIATGTSDKDGLVVFNNANKEEMLLQSGKYFVKETKAPTDYNRYTDVIPAEISVTYGDALTNGTYIVKGPDLGLVSFDVKNSKTVTDLPIDYIKFCISLPP